ncbi:MAG: hypothetical protein JW941_05760, partial [Candidatus Coatesbacteria bacterium]|nr:hypothetical protein [Candidatus Coatesbacteria bacterium]
IFFDHTDDFNFLYPLSFSKYPSLFLPHWNFYRPLPEIFWLLEFRAFGVHPLPYRLSAWLLHYLCVLAVFALASMLSRNRFLATGAALFISQQPTLDDTVARLGGNIDVLFTLPYLVCLLLYVVYRKRGARLFLVLSIISGIAALLSKEMAISLPLILFLIELVFFSSGSNLIRRVVSALARMWPFIALTAAHIFFFILRPFSSQQGQFSVISDSRSLALHVLHNIKLLFRGVFAPLSLVVPVILIGGYFLLRREAASSSEPYSAFNIRRFALFGLGSIVLCPIPVVPLPISIEGHSFYLPAIAAGFLIMACIAEIRNRLASRGRRLTAIPIAVLCLILLTLNFHLKGALFEFTRINKVKGSIPMSIAEQVDANEAHGPIALVFMPGEEVKTVGTDIINFWVAGAKFMLRDRVDVNWVHDYLMRRLWLKEQAPMPEFWVCRDFKASRDHAMGERVRALIDFRASLDEQDGLGPAPSPDEPYLKGPSSDDVIEWDFVSGFSDWRAVHGSAISSGGGISLNPEGGKVILENPSVDFNSWFLSTVELAVKAGPEADNSVWRIYYRSEGDEGWPEFKNSIILINKDGVLHTNSAFMLVYLHWSYERRITGLRLVVEDLWQPAILGSISLAPNVPSPPRINLPSIAPSAGLDKGE